jgi:hypothetical protein
LSLTLNISPTSFEFHTTDIHVIYISRIFPTFNITPNILHHYFFISVSPLSLTPILEVITITVCHLLLYPFPYLQSILHFMSFCCTKDMKLTCRHNPWCSMCGWVISTPVQYTDFRVVFLNFCWQPLV